jgi:ElaB/YqjD/DUF883 family membrane-anchored ribosome-binding protein
MNTQIAPKLSQKYPSVAKNIEQRMHEAQELGAWEGVQRLKHICDQYDQLTPNSAYLWLDPYAFQHEIEEEQMHHKGALFLAFCRNVFSLAPIISTWTTLLLAVNSYQSNWFSHPEDRAIPFLQQWQEGFHGTTSLTFTLAAGTTVFFLLCYLITILRSHALDSRIHGISTSFVQRLQTTIDELIQCIMRDSIASITQQSDIDRVVRSIQTVIDSSTTAVKEMANHAIEINEKALRQTQQSVQQVITCAQQSLKQVVSATENSVAQSNSVSQQAILKVVTESEKVIMQSHTASQQAISNTNSKMEALFDQQIKPLIQTFQQDMGSLQKELGNYQGRLNDLTVASQQVAQASQQLLKVSTLLTDNADRYIAIGQDIGVQIAALNTTQDQVRSQIETIVSSITTVVGHMGTATSNMVAATSSVEDLTRDLGNEMRKTAGIAIAHADRNTQQVNQLSSALRTTSDKMATTVDQATNTMQNNIGQSTQALSQVSYSLQATARQLDKTASLLSSAQPRSFRDFLFGKQPRQP